LLWIRTSTTEVEHGNQGNGQEPEASGSATKAPPLKQTAIDILQSWCEGDEEDEREQRETMQFLRKALDEGRPPGYKLFE
jgi:hypothetical protein